MLVGNDDFDLRAGGNGSERPRAKAIHEGPLGTSSATVGRALWAIDAPCDQHPGLARPRTRI